MTLILHLYVKCLVYIYRCGRLSNYATKQVSNYFYKQMKAMALLCRAVHTLICPQSAATTSSCLSFKLTAQFTGFRLVLSLLSFVRIRNSTYSIIFIIQVQLSGLYQGIELCLVVGVKPEVGAVYCNLRKHQLLWDILKQSKHIF